MNGLVFYNKMLDTILIYAESRRGWVLIQSECKEPTPLGFKPHRLDCMNLVYLGEF